MLPEKVYLFGSFAEGRATEESDYDFYIVVNDSEKDMLRLTARAYKAIRDKQYRPVDIIVNTSKTFEERKKRDSSVESEVAKKGVLLYGIAVSYPGELCLGNRIICIQQAKPQDSP